MSSRYLHAVAFVLAASVALLTSAAFAQLPPPESIRNADSLRKALAERGAEIEELRRQTRALEHELKLRQQQNDNLHKFLEKIAENTERMDARFAQAIDVQQRQFHEFKAAIAEQKARDHERQAEEMEKRHGQFREKFERWTELKHRLRDWPIRLEVMQAKADTLREQQGEKHPQTVEAREDIIVAKRELQKTAVEFAKLERDLTGRFPITPDVAKTIYEQINLEDEFERPPVFPPSRSEPDKPIAPPADPFSGPAPDYNPFAEPIEPKKNDPFGGPAVEKDSDEESNPFK